ncbi:LytS/YhcK type 5TM receptor domain-containing protein, partial [Escherichia coli]
MHEIFNMLLAVFDRAALMLICLFFLIRIRLFRELLHKSAHSPKELLAVTAIFSLFALFSTWSGVPVEGSLVNVRIIAVNRPGFPGEYFICELRLPDHYFRWKHNKLFLLLPE